MEPGICRLCLKEAELCKSHIIPEAFFRPLYDDAVHKFDAVSVDPETRPVRKPTGEYERLLCEGCERHIQPWEDYAAKLVFGGPRHTETYTRSGRFSTIHGVDYQKLKLFQMSVLWRASVCTRPFFDKVQLGPHEDELRQSLRESDPGPAERYGCAMMGVMDGDEPLSGLMVGPTESRIDGHRVYRFIFGALSWIFFVSSERHDVPATWRLLFAQEDGTLVITSADVKELKQVRELFRRIADSQPDWLNS